MDVKAVLVAVDHASGRAGVMIDADGDVWLTDSLERAYGTMLEDHRPGQVGLEDDRTVLGGRLPRGAVSAEAVIDGGERVACEVGDGAWVVVLDQTIVGLVSPVVFRDGAGVPVAPPLPEEWSRVPVSDSDESCPGCDARAWDVVTPTDTSRGSRSAARGWEPTPVIVCRVCGHEEPMGAIIRIEPRDDEDPAVVQARIRDSEETRRLSHQMLLSAVTFALYCAEGERGRVAGSGSSGDRVSSVTLAHGSDDPTRGPSLRITTALEDGQPHVSEAALAREALTQRLHHGLVDWTSGSDAAFVLALRGNQRTRRRAASRAIVRTREIAVDDAPIAFATVQSGSHWAAVACVDSLIITVTATDVDPGTVRLRSVPDPAKTLL